MQTQCPHCDTQFRVTESQVNTADGFVRCGVCKEVFNAFEVASTDKHQQSLLDDLPAGVNNETVTDRQLETTGPEPEKQQTDIQSDLPTASETIDFNETSATDQSRKDAFDFFNEEINDSLQHVVPDELRDSYSNGSHTLVSSLLWSAGILILITSLFIEYAMFNRHQLIQVAELKPLIEKLCQFADCENITIRDTSKIELVTRNIYTHPQQKNALMIAVTMKNNAGYAQAYPVMQISFSDVRGGSIAARRFFPTEYLQINQQNMPLLAPGSSISFNLEIQDPGKQAKTYEFDFL